MTAPKSGWPDILFTDDLSRAALSKAVRDGRARRISPGIYTSLRFGSLEDIVRRNWSRILDHELPGAIITDRSARRSGPSEDMLTVVHRRKRPLQLPGLTIMPRPGPPPLPDDAPMSSVWFASQARAMLENLHGRGGPRYLSRTELEGWIADLLLSGGENLLNDIRDRARSLAQAGGWDREFATLSAIIGAALSTHPSDILQTEKLRASASGTPYDHQRLDLFGALATALGDLSPQPLPLRVEDEARRTLLPFYEAYFSNYIEGTEFTLDEAASIVLDHHFPSDRPQDAHDILGTFQLVNDPDEASRTPEDADQLIEILRQRHGHLMQARVDKNPGAFKVKSNQAGSTVFVAPGLVVETLRRGFDLGRKLVEPFARSVYLGFVVSEVHPFDDGNGRISRIMANAELSRAGEGRIIIPTIFRNNYIAALKGASHNTNFGGLAATLKFAQRYTARIDFTTRQSAEADLVRTNALRDPNDADDAGVRLMMPA